MGLVCTATTGCGGSGGVSSAVVLARQLDPAAIGQKAIDLYDTDKSSSIDAAELKKSLALESAVNRIDANKDGGLSGDEIADRVEQYQQQSDLVPFQLRLQRKGAPVSGANVIVTPDPMWGDGALSFQGTSDEAGNVVLAPPEDVRLPGFPVGLYTIRITGPVDVTKGCEVAEDVPSSLRMTLAL